MIQRIATILAVAIGLVAAFVFALTALVIALVAGLALWLWLRWKAPRGAVAPREDAAGRVIDGEVVVVDEAPARIAPPASPEPPASQDASDRHPP